MTLQGSGPISLNDVNVEMQKSPTALISLNDSNVRTLAEIPTGTISMSNLYGKTYLPTFTFVGFVEDDTASATSTSIGAPSGTTSGDITVLFAWCDTLNNPTLSATDVSGSYTKIGQLNSTSRPSVGAWYSTGSTGSVTISSSLAGAWNVVRMSFRPNRTVNGVTVGASDFTQNSGSYTHSITAPTNGSSYTYIHAFGVSGRPQDNLSVPSTITGSPTPTINDDSSVDSHAVTYYSIFSPGTSSLPNYSYNNITDSGQQSSGIIWLGFN